MLRLQGCVQLPCYLFVFTLAAFRPAAVLIMLLNMLQVTPSDYKGSICLSIAGHHINGVGIALIVVAILIVIVLLSLVCYCCCCRW